MIKEQEVIMKARIVKIMQMEKIAIAKLIIPFCFASVVVILLSLAGPEIYTDYVKVFTIYMFMPLFGLEAAIPAGLALGIHPAALISFLLFIDTVVALFLVWNFNYATKIPLLGKLVERMEKSGEKAIKKHKWVQRIGFIGLTIFVIIPLQYTGSVVGAIVGRLLGMPPLTTMLAVVVGCFIRCTIVTLVSIGVLSFLKI